MRDPHVEHLRYLHGEDNVCPDIAELGDMAILRNDIEILNRKVDHLARLIQELPQKLNT